VKLHLANALELLFVANRERPKQIEGGFASAHGVVQCAIEIWRMLNKVRERDGEILDESFEKHKGVLRSAFCLCSCEVCLSRETESQ
jgi:hypothetical protein